MAARGKAAQGAETLLNLLQQQKTREESAPRQPRGRREELLKSDLKKK